MPRSTREAWGSSSFTRAPKSTCDDALGRSPSAKRTPRINLQHYGGRRPVLPCVEDSVRRPQRPGNQCTHRSAFLEEPSCQFTLENCQEPPALPQCSGRACKTSRLNACHCARCSAAQQGKTRPPLCRNCECPHFLVETYGKRGDIVWDTDARRTGRNVGMVRGLPIPICIDQVARTLLCALCRSSLHWSPSMPSPHICRFQKLSS